VLSARRTGLLDLYHQWGRHYGTAAQLSNDLHDAENQQSKSDIERHKGTLPLLYARAIAPPMQTTEPTSGLAVAIAFSTWTGDTFFPAEVTMISFLRSTMR